jgi:hypothetical protein
MRPPSKVLIIDATRKELIRAFFSTLPLVRTGLRAEKAGKSKQNRTSTRNKASADSIAERIGVLAGIFAYGGAATPDLAWARGR